VKLVSVNVDGLQLHVTHLDLRRIIFFVQPGMHLQARPGASGRNQVDNEDEILAVDKITWTGTTPSTSTFWTLADHQGTIRDIVSGNAADRGKVVEHRQYDSFGKIARQTTGPQANSPATLGVGIDFRDAGRPLESRTGLSDNRARFTAKRAGCGGKGKTREVGASRRSSHQGAASSVR